MKQNRTAIIVDDEQEAIDYLTILMREAFPEIELVDTASNSEEALNSIYRFHPDLVLLDIKIDGRDGFDILKEIQKNNHLPHIIFVTAFNTYAIEAFRVNAIDYLLKPVEKKELQRAVSKFIDQTEHESYVANLKSIFENHTEKVRFNSRTGFILIDPAEILYCQSDGNYSEIYLADNTRKIVSYNLRNLMSIINNSSFHRISRFHLINEKYLVEVDKSKHSCFLINGKETIELTYSPRFFEI